jgi:Fur family ferric uptake transcriptional regulator
MPKVATSDQLVDHEWRHRLHSAGLRVTTPRLAVLSVLSQYGHLTAKQIGEAVSQQIGPTAGQTIYDALQALTTAGLLRRLESAGSPGLFEHQRGDNHHHLICRSCRQVVDVDCHAVNTPCLHLPAPHRSLGDDQSPEAGGFIVDEAEIVFWGLCPDCQTDSPAKPTPPLTYQIGI